MAGTAAVTSCSATGGCSALFTSRPPSTAATQDCDDTTAARSPTVTETCNEVDDDCDGTADDGLPLATYYLDADGDGRHGTAVMGCRAQTGWSATSSDCNDANAMVFAGQTELMQAPHCPAGWAACDTGHVWACYDQAGCGFSGVPFRPEPSWDYDCDGVSTRVPSAAAACGGGFSCITGGGWDASDPCGTWLPASGGRCNWYCARACSGCSGCVVARTDAYMACR